MIDLLSIQLKGVLENAVFTKVKALGVNVGDSTLRAIISRIAEESAVGIVGSVNLGANKQINSIPTNLIGINNPVNTITNNISSQVLAGNLSNILDVQITGQATDKIVSALDRELKAILPADKYNLINFSALASTLVQSITPSVSGAVNTALKTFTDGIFNRGTTTSPVLPGIENIFGSLPGGSALDKINENYAAAGANRYLQQSKQFNVNNESNQEKLNVINQGFTDPNANYPTKEYQGKPDTNKLATGDLSGGSIVQTKNLERMLGAKLPGGESWDEPNSAYNAEYPYNKITQTESGHIYEVDDTPGSERLHLFHRAGTYVEIDSNGSMVRRIRGSNYEIIDRNGKISISGRADISINGACNIFVGNDANIEVEGDTNITCYNDITAQAAGNVNISAKDTLNLTGGNVNIQAYDSMNVISNVSLNLHATEDFNLHSNAILSLHSSNVINMLSNSEISVQAVNMFTKVEENSYNQTGGDYHILAGGDFNADSGGDAHINSGNAQESKDSQLAKLAGVSLIGVLEERKDVTPVDLNDPIPLTLVDSYTLDVEEDKQDITENKAHRDKLITKGIVSPEDLDKTPVEQDSASVTSTQTIIVPGSEDLKKATKLPGNYNLSPNFTLEMLTTKAAVTRDEIETSELSYGQIVFNLQQVALNILEPVYNLYPNAFVTSGYRQRAKSSKTSQHPTGCAVDIQFRGVSKADYFDIAKKLAKVLKYDQMLLEYSAYTNNPWIHISFVGTNDRSQTLTFWNHKVHSQGFTQLA